MENDQIFILSDLHLNLLPSKKRSAFLHFFEHIVAPRSVGVYLNGDIIDLMAPEMAPEARKDLTDFANLLTDMAFRGIGIHHILGNHDLPLLLAFPTFQLGNSNFVEVHKELESVEVAQNFYMHYRSVRFTYRGKRVYIEHGHIYDLGWVSSMKWQQAWEQAAGVKLNKSWVDNIFALWEIFNGHGEDYSARLMRTGAHLPPPIYASREGRRLASDLDQDWVILSHFHSPALEELGGGRVYANPGDSLQHGNYITLVDGEIRIGDWRELTGVNSDE